MNGHNPAYLDCLIAAMSFDGLWGIYVQSDGKLWGDQLYPTGRVLVDRIEAISNLDATFLASVKPPVQTDRGFAAEFDLFKSWMRQRSGFPRATVPESKLFVQNMIAGLTVRLGDLLGATTKGLFFSWDLGTESFRDQIIRWKPFLPLEFLQKRFTKMKEDEVVAKLSGSRSIVVFGDIRKSQDLMTYGSDPDRYSKFILFFISKVRVLLDKHLGVFDKFTGDGFVGYFNDWLCGEMGRSAGKAFVEFTRELATFCREHFAAWTTELRKLPEVEIGLAVGADYGKISFLNEDGQLIAWGDALVWAARMSAAAGAREVWLNNQLVSHCEHVSELKTTEVVSQTKSGEGFRANCWLP